MVQGEVTALDGDLGVLLAGAEVDDVTTLAGCAAYGDVGFLGASNLLEGLVAGDVDRHVGLVMGLDLLEVVASGRVDGDVGAAVGVDLLDGVGALEVDLDGGRPVNLDVVDGVAAVEANVQVLVGVDLARGHADYGQV